MKDAPACVAAAGGIVDTPICFGNSLRVVFLQA
ncbi:unnamed protein product [Victoria cruziana]